MLNLKIKRVPYWIAMAMLHELAFALFKFGQPFAVVALAIPFFFVVANRLSDAGINHRWSAIFVIADMGMPTQHMVYAHMSIILVLGLLPTRKVNQGEHHVIVDCLNCRQKLRINALMPLEGTLLKCSRCLSKFNFFLDDKTAQLVLYPFGQKKPEPRQEDKINEQEPKPNSQSSRKSHNENLKIPQKRELSLKDCYAILDISPDCDLAAIRKAYKQKISEYHPDKVALLGDKLKKLAVEESKMINAAYETLKKYS